MHTAAQCRPAPLSPALAPPIPPHPTPRHTLPSDSHGTKNLDLAQQSLEVKALLQTQRTEVDNLGGIYDAVGTDAATDHSVRPLAQLLLEDKAEVGERLLDLRERVVDGLSNPHSRCRRRRRSSSTTTSSLGSSPTMAIYPFHDDLVWLSSLLLLSFVDVGRQGRGRVRPEM